MSLIDANKFGDDDSTDYSYDVSDEELEWAEELSSRRHASYEAGETTDDNWSDSADIMLMGTITEMAIADAYEHLGAEFDTSVSSDGDDGYDHTMRFPSEGEELTVDVKSSSYSGRNPSLMVAEKNHNSRPETPDAYLSVYVSDSFDTIRIRGWILEEELVDDENLTESRAGDWLNYEVPISELNEMPEPDWD